MLPLRCADSLICQKFYSRNCQLLLQERAEVVASNKGEIEGLFDKRSSAEQAFLERYMAAAEAFEKQLEDLRCADAEDYNLLKVRCRTACVAIPS